jgi:hypothetical protein
MSYLIFSDYYSRISIFEGATRVGNNTPQGGALFSYRLAGAYLNP